STRRARGSGAGATSRACRVGTRDSYVSMDEAAIGHRAQELQDLPLERLPRLRRVLLDEPLDDGAHGVLARAEADDRGGRRVQDEPLLRVEQHVPFTLAVEAEPYLRRQPRAALGRDH